MEWGLQVLEQIEEVSIDLWQGYKSLVTEMMPNAQVVADRFTIVRWLDEIIAYFDNRTTSGVVEGINNKLKLIKRSAYGFRNFDNFRLRCLLTWRFKY
jgi:transposase